ncbi:MULTISPECIES: type II toxin-antitoxin system VapB family antitoxin [Glaesserella]|uniref:AbrB/MazE/SpoVT family DNA-binding domain-containing protein n=1 Tax=Glaesserella australis TaxID=2094024 RepID=A0A328C111_9PAST|nr:MULTISPECIES: type II toxin-antitoxin system VapB family antitoxin [Glaesserella]AUI66905.1 AbrB/MazE/SpoVT family DNA-binding domain-containing protein [Glaesserella sp. 15-184]RAL19531.1 AbrB/MazE/SpoVT family DNA-binding domain-containing protein [Glaesserella australis]
MEASVFITNRTQAVRLPSEMRFANDVKRVSVRIVGNERILTPLNQRWDSFFLNSDNVSDDFMAEREVSIQPEREEL